MHTTYTSPALELPLGALAHHLWRHKKQTLMVALTIAMCAAIFSILTLEYTANSVMRVRTVSVNQQPISDANSDVRYINSPNFAQMVANHVSNPVKVHVATLTRAQQFWRRITSAGNKENPLLYIANITYTGTLAPPHLNVTKTSASTFEITSSAGDSTPVTGTIGEVLSLPDITVNIAKIDGAVGSRFTVHFVSRDAFLQDVEASVRARTTDSSNSMFKPSAGANIVEIRATHADPSYAMFMAQAARSAYLQFSSENDAAPIQQGRRQLQASLAEQVKSLTTIQEETKRLLTDMGVADFAETASRLNEELKQVNQDLTKIETDYVSVLHEVTEDHPAAISMKSQLQFLKSKKADLEEQRNALPMQELSYMKLQQQADVLKKQVDATTSALSQLEVRASSSGQAVEAMGEIFLDKTSLLYAGFRAAISGFAFSMILLLGARVGSFLYRYIHHGIYLSIAHQHQIPILGSLTLPTQHVDGRNPNSNFKALSQMVVSAPHIARTIEKLGHMPSSNLVFITHNAHAHKGALFTMSAAIFQARQKAGGRICVVDADVANGHCTLLMNQRSEAGLAGVLLGETLLFDAMVAILPDRLDFLPAGPLPMNFSMITEQGGLNRILDELTQHYDHVFVHMPPVNVWADWYEKSRHKAVVIQTVTMGTHVMGWVQDILRMPAKLRGSLYLLLCREKSKLWTWLGDDTPHQ